MAGKRKLEEALQESEQKTQQEKEEEKEEEKKEEKGEDKKDEKTEEEKKDVKVEEGSLEPKWDGESLFGESDEDWIPPENPLFDASWERSSLNYNPWAPRATVWMVPEGFSLGRDENGLVMFPSRSQ